MRVLLVADGRSEVGLGHVVRALAVAEAAQAAGHDVGVATIRSTAAEELGRELGIELLDHGTADQTVADVVLLDGYNFDQSDVDRYRRSAGLVAAMVDFGQTGLDVDLLVNPNTTQPVRQPNRRTVQLLGPRYAPLRRRFRDATHQPSGERSLLVTAGGTDPAGLTALVLEHLPSRHPFEVVRVVVGPNAVGVAPMNGLVIERQPVDMCRLMATSHAAIAAAGSTVWELCCIGVPAAVVRVADNQDLLLKTVGAGRAALTFPDPSTLVRDLPNVLTSLVEPKIARSLASSARGLVDGRGAVRILAGLEDAVVH